MNSHSTNTDNKRSHVEGHLTSGVPVILTFVPVVVLLAGFYFYQQMQLRDQVFTAAQARGEFLFSTISYQVSDSLYTNNIEQIRKDSEFLIAQPGIRRLAVFAEDGRYLFDSAQEKVPSGNIENSLLDLSSRAFGTLTRWGPQHIEFIGAVRFDGDMMGGLYLETETSAELAAAERSLRETMVGISLLAAMFLAFAFAIVRFLGARRSLEIVQSNYQNLIEHSPLPHAIYKASGELSYFNPALADLMSTQPATRHTIGPGYNILKDPILIANGVVDLLRPGFAGGTADIPTFAYSTESLDEYESGTLWLRAAVSPLRNQDGGLAEVVVIYEDKTAEKKAEAERAELNAQILQSQKLEGLGVMARGIAHDFNNLLTPVMGNADLLSNLLKDNERYTSLTSKIIVSARRASDLCGQLLAYGGRGTRAKSLVDVSAELREVSELLRSSISKKTIFEQNLADDLPPVLVDDSQFRQVVLNLIINASEALGENQGVVTLTTGVQELAAETLQKLLPEPDLPAGTYVFLQVRDTGCGMDAETQKNLFDPFFTTKFTGRGLGMSTVLGIVGEHAGGIAVESELEQGSSFTVYLPASEQVLERDFDPGNTDTKSASGAVLLVDDEIEVLEVGQKALESLGYRVFTASNGAEALRMYESNQNNIKCVVMDLLMPVMDGEEALGRLRRMNPELPMVIVTGLGSDLERLTQYANLCILNKPYEIRDLEQAISSVAKV